MVLPPFLNQHCTDEAQKAETVRSVVIDKYATADSHQINM